MSEILRSEKTPNKISEADIQEFRRQLLDSDLPFPEWSQHSEEFKFEEPSDESNAVANARQDELHTLNQTHKAIKNWVLDDERKETLTNQNLKKFRALLQKEGFDHHQIDYIFKTHINPITDRLSELQSRMKGLGNSDTPPEDPAPDLVESQTNVFLNLAALQESNREAQIQRRRSEDEVKELRLLSNNLRNDLLVFMRSFLKSPEKFMVAATDGEALDIKDIKLSAEELQDRLYHNSPAEVFVVNGHEMTPANKLNACRALLREQMSGIDDANIKRRVINDNYFNRFWLEMDGLVRELRSANDRVAKDHIRQKLKEQDTKLVLFMEDLLEEGGIEKYALWAANGTPNRVSEDAPITEQEFMAVDFPEVRLGRSEILRAMIANPSVNDEEVWQREYREARKLVTSIHYLDTYPPNTRDSSGSLHLEKTIDRVEAAYREGETPKEAVQSLMFFPDGRAKSRAFLTAEIEELFSRSGFSEGDFMDFYATTLYDIFDEIDAIRHGERDDTDAQGERINPQKRRRAMVRQQYEKIVSHVSEWLNYDDDERELETFAIAGGALGRGLTLLAAPSVRTELSNVELVTQLQKAVNEWKETHPDEKDELIEQFISTAQRLEQAGEAEDVDEIRAELIDLKTQIITSE